MNKYLLSIRRRPFFIITLLLIIFAGFAFLPKSAGMQSESISPEQVISPLKRLSFSRRSVASNGASNFLISINADGTESQLLSNFDLALYDESTWSPDGTKLAYVTFLPSQTGVNSANINLISAAGGNSTPIANSDANERNPSWSVTGKIVYERDAEIWTMNEDGTNQVLFTGISQPSPKSPKWSHDGLKIAFTSGGEIWVINADGTNERRVTNNSTFDSEPDWSPDGLKLVYQKESSGIAVINLDGTNEVNITNSRDDRTPAWSNDNTKIAFVRRGTLFDGLYVMDINGGNQVRIVVDTFQNNRGTLSFDPAWRRVDLQPNTFTISGRITESSASSSGATVSLTGSATAQTITDAIGNYQFSNLPGGGNYTVAPLDSKLIFTPSNYQYSNLIDDKIGNFFSDLRCAKQTCAANGKIAFVGSRPFTSNTNSIYTMNPDGSNLTQIAPAAVSHPRYSSDGSQIVFEKFNSISNEVFKMNADGSSVVQLTNAGAFGVNNLSAAFSPDSQSIVFRSSRDGNYEIYKMNADGTNQVRLTNNSANDSFPSYSPDGTKIIFTRGPNLAQENLYVMNSDGTNQTALPTPAGSYISPSYSPDGTKIIVSYSTSTQTNYFIHTMNADGTAFTGTSIGGNDPSYSPDGRKVIFSTNSSINIVDADFAGSPVVLQNNFNHFEVDWQPIVITNNVPPRSAPFDFDGDERADVSVFRPSDGIWYQLRSTAGFSAIQFGLSDDNLTPADYDGDLKTDVAVWRGSNGNFYIINSSNGTIRVENFGLSGDIPTVGDWDGDGKADLSVYRGGSNGVFYYRASSNNPNGNISNIPWGISGDKPVSGDFDGDGQMDAAVFRPSNGVWYIRKSSDGQLLAYNFGLATDKLVPADYDGDLKTDIAVYRNGVWYILRSSDGGFTILQFGVSTDVPTPADYDGDGKADISVYRDGVWYILQTSNGNAKIVQFGLAADKPIAASFIQ